MSNDNAFNGKLGVNMVLDSTPDTGPRVHAKENPRVSEMDKREEIKQWALDKAMGELAGPGVHVHSTSYAMVVDRFAVALSQARSQAFEEAADLIDEGFKKVVGEPYRDDGKPSKNDKCPHGRYMYEDCESCCSQAIRQHSQKGER